MPRPRNIIARNPLMRKGGVHEGQRPVREQRLAAQLQDRLDEWEEEQAEDSVSEDDATEVTE